jgi:hypothetical protein
MRNKKAAGLEKGDAGWVAVHVSSFARGLGVNRQCGELDGLRSLCAHWPRSEGAIFDSIVAEILSWSLSFARVTDDTLDCADRLPISL